MNRIFKNLIPLMLVLLVTNAIMAQEQQQRSVRDSYDFQKNAVIYQRAMKYNDAQTAKTALYNLIALEPQNDSLLFSLAYMYFENRQYISSLLASRDVLTINPDHLAALEVSAISYENVGAREKALEAYESLYLKNEDISTLYKVAFLQYELNRFQEAKTTTEIIMDKPEAEEVSLYFNTSENQQQEVPMKASIYNLRGMIHAEEGDNQEARDNYNKALEISPDFELAKENLNQLE